MSILYMQSMDNAEFELNIFIKSWLLKIEDFSNVCEINVW